MTLARSFLSALLTLILALPLSAQPARQQIDSQVLGEKRTILVHLPATYASRAAAYPVLYLTDGERQLNHTAATVDYLAREGRIPEMIVVGIINTDRTRDLTPAPIPVQRGNGQELRFPTSGGASKFLSFIEQEVIPHVEKSYRTLPYRVFAGHSFGGLFALHAMFSRPQLFHGVLAVSPAIVLDSTYVGKAAQPFLASHPQLDRTLVVTIGNEGAALDRNFEALRALFSRRMPKDFRLITERFADEDHGSVVMPSHYLGLRKIFEPWRFPLPSPDEDPALAFPRAREHYSNLSKRLGFTVPVPEGTTNLIGYRLLQRNRHDDAIAVFKANVDAYPQSANVYDSLAEAYEAKGELPLAKENYERAAGLGQQNSDPNTAVYQANAERVGKAIAAARASS